MKAITFVYTKKDGSTSSRYLLATAVPGDKFSGVDISDMDPDEAESYITEMTALHLQYTSMATAISAKYDLKHNYRQFLESGMSDIEEI